MSDRADVPEGVRRLAHRWLGSGIGISRAASGGSTLVYRVTRGRETFWLRLAEEAGEDRSAEWEAHRRLVAAGARVPEIVIAEVAPPELDRSACITTHTPGVPLLECRDPAIARRVAEEAGKDLQRINTIEIRGFGFVSATDTRTGEVVGQFTIRLEWLEETRRALERVTALGVLAEHTAATLNDRLAGYLVQDRFATHSLAAHGDFDTSHIYHDPATGTYTGIIDFGEIMGADREWDLGHALAHDGQGNVPSIVDALMTGWGDADRDRVRTCAVVVALRRLARHHASAYGRFLATRIGDLLP